MKYPALQDSPQDSPRTAHGAAEWQLPVHCHRDRRAAHDATLDAALCSTEVNPQEGLPAADPTTVCITFVSQAASQRDNNDTAIWTANQQPSSQPTGSPTAQPTGQPTTQPSSQPMLTTSQPSALPTANQVQCPALILRCNQPQPEELWTTLVPADKQAKKSAKATPSMQPSGQPTSDQVPTQLATKCSTLGATSTPSAQPSSQPTGEPSSQPSNQPSANLAVDLVACLRVSPQVSRLPNLQLSQVRTFEPTN